MKFCGLCDKQIKKGNFSDESVVICWRCVQILLSKNHKEIQEEAERQKNKNQPLKSYLLMRFISTQKVAKDFSGVRIRVRE